MCSNRSETWIDYGERRITAAVVVGGGERRDSDAGSCHLISGEERWLWLWSDRETLRWWLVASSLMAEQESRKEEKR